MMSASELIPERKKNDRHRGPYLYVFGFEVPNLSQKAVAVYALPLVPIFPNPHQFSVILNTSIESVVCFE